MGRREHILKKIIVALLIAIMTLSVAMLSACGGGESESSNDGVKAADPMTEEELQEVNPEDGCVGEDNDSLY